MRPIETRRAVDEAADQLRTEILTGVVPTGARLPPERELAATLRINRQTLRAAMGRLEAEGLIRARHGSGVEVLDWRRTAGVALIPALVSVGRTELVRPFLELRRAVAVEAVASACALASEEALDALARVAAELAEEHDPDRLAEGNLAFSRRVLELADNLPMELLFNTVAAVQIARPELRAALLAHADAVRASFPAVVALLRTRDPDAARAGVRASLEALDTATLAFLSESPDVVAAPVVS